MDKIKTVKIKNPDGSVSEETYTISVDAKDVDMANGKELQETIGTIDIDTDGNIAKQLENLNDNVDDLNIDIKKKAYFFDTVADMKNANLKVGDYVCTLGYYEANDGGAGDYKIVSSTNNYKENLNNGLYAELIIENKINVKQLGAKGDNLQEDFNYFNIAKDICLNKNLILYIPYGQYKISTSLNLKSIIIRCEGILKNTQSIIVGGNSNGSTYTDVYIFRCNDITVEGAKCSNFNITHCQNLILSCDGTVTNNTSIAYNQFFGIDCNHITLTGSNNGWINENEFNIKRCLTGILITGDTYSHNNNHFENICIEGSSAIIQIDKGHNNYITYRGEDNPQIILSSDYTKVYDNIIKKQVSSNVANTILPADFNAVKSFNFIGNDYLPNYRVERIYELTKANVKNLNSQIFINNQGHITGTWQNEFLSEKLDASFPFIIYINSSNNSQRLYVTCYDENSNKIQGNVFSGGLTWDSTNNWYQISSNAKSIMFTFVPSTDVKYIDIRVGVGGNVTFDYMYIDMYLPFTNTETFRNTIITDKKYLNQIPSNFTNLNPTWEVGDIIYNSNPSNNILGWVCVTAGTGSSSV